MKKILVVNGNPDASPERLTAALARAYGEGAKAAGHSVTRLDVGTLEFSLLDRAGDFQAPARDAAIRQAQQALLECEHLVLIYPLWLGSAPARLKGFLEQLACGDFLLQKRGAGFPLGRLKGRSARVIVTMGMPPLLYRLIYGAHGVRALNRSILGIAGIGPIATSLFGGGQIAAGAARVIDRVTRLGRRAA